MKAVQYREIGKGPEVVDIDTPEPGPGQIRLRVTAAGLCHSDWFVMDLPEDQYTYGLPLTLGHEGVGVVDMLGDLPDAPRTARYQAVLVLMRHPDDPTPLICQGTWEGEILLAPRGNGGFGYDPHFLIPELGVTAAEMEPAEKNRISHRGRALKALMDALREPSE